MSLLVVGLGLYFAVSSRADILNYTDPGVPPSQSNFYATGINDSGDVFGYSTDTSGKSKAYLLQNGVFTGLIPPGYPYATVYFSPVYGDVLIQAYNDLYIQRTFLWQNSEFTDLTPSGWYSSSIYFRNPYSKIMVGFGKPSSESTNHAFLIDDNNVTDLHPFGWDWSYAAASNSSGIVVGAVYSSSTYKHHAFLWENDSAIDFHPSGWDSSTATSINDEGAILGYRTKNNTYEYKAFLWENGNFSNLHPSEEYAYSMAHRNFFSGKIIVFAMDSQYTSYTYLWENGSFTSLTPSGWLSSYVYEALPNIYLGHGKISSGDQHAFLWEGNTINDLHPSGWMSSRAVMINNSGMIVGNGETSSGENHIFITHYSGGSSTCTESDGDGYYAESGCGTQTDCNDGNSAIHPGAIETCDGLDNNCNGQIDEGVKNTYYRDADGDGYGDSGYVNQACFAPNGYVSNNADCNDNPQNNGSMQYPGRTEDCDNIDNNCNGVTDEGQVCDNTTTVINLNNGWNLISLCLEPEDTNIDRVLAPIVGKYTSVWAFVAGIWRVYDPQNPPFSDLLTMEAIWGYWINMTEAATLTVFGSPQCKSLSLVDGWNLVPCGCIDPLPIIPYASTLCGGKYVSIWAFMEGTWKVFDPVNPGFSDLTTLECGHGCWINTTEACDWILPQ